MNVDMMKISLLALFTLGSLSYGQERASDDKRGYLRFLFLGTPAPAILREQNGVMVEQDVPEGEEPPEFLFARNASADTAVFQAKLKRSSKYLEVIDRSKSVDLFQGRQPKGGIWFKAKASTIPSTVVVMKETMEDDGWKNSPRTLTLKDDLRSFPLHTARVVNLSSRDVAIRVGQDRAIRPTVIKAKGGAKVIGAKEGVKVGEMIVGIGAKGRSGRYSTIFQNSIMIMRNQRFEIYLYDPDRARDRARGGKPQLLLMPQDYRDPRQKESKRRETSTGAPQN
jgi:hypothetical protein